MTIIAYVDTNNACALCLDCFGTDIEVDYSEMTPVYCFEETGDLVCDNCLSCCSASVEEGTPSIKSELADFYSLGTIIGFKSTELHTVCCDYCASYIEEKELQEKYEALFDNAEGLVCKCGHLLGDDED